MSKIFIDPLKLGGTWIDDTIPDDVSEHAPPWNKGLKGVQEPTRSQGPGEMNGMYGKKHSEETKKKISESLKGFKHSPEARENMGKWQKGVSKPKQSLKMKEYWRKKKGETI